MPPILRVGARDDQSAFPKGREHSAQVAGIERECGGDFGRSRIVAMRELVEDPDFSEREVAVHVRIAEGADARRVEAVEIPDRLGVVIELAHETSLGPIVDFVNYAVILRSAATKDLLSLTGNLSGKVGPS